MARVWDAEYIGDHSVVHLRDLENRAFGFSGCEADDEVKEEHDEVWEKIHASSLEAARAGLKKGGSFKGMLVKHHVADSFALYVVINDKGGVDLGHVNLMDGYRATEPWERGFNKGDLKREAGLLVAFADAIDRRKAGEVN